MSQWDGTMPHNSQETVVVPREPTEAMLWRGFDARGAMTDLRHVHLVYRAMISAAPASPDPLPPHCQRCGGEIHGWCCQSCPSEFREDDSGNLIFDEGSPDPLLEEAVGLLREYRDKTPLGHQPHMIAARADAFLSKVEERGHD